MNLSKIPNSENIPEKLWKCVGKNLIGQSYENVPEYSCRQPRITLNVSQNYSGSNPEQFWKCVRTVLAASKLSSGSAPEYIWKPFRIKKLWNHLATVLEGYRNKHPWSILKTSKQIFGTISKQYWKCDGIIPWTYKKRSGSVLEYIWSSVPRTNLGIFWNNSHGFIPTHFQRYAYMILKLWFDTFRTVPEYFQTCSDTLPELYWHGCKIMLWCLQNCSRILSDLFRYTFGIAIAYFQNCYQMSPEFFLPSGLQIYSGTLPALSFVVSTVFGMYNS